MTAARTRGAARSGYAGFTLLAILGALLVPLDAQVGRPDPWAVAAPPPAGFDRARGARETLEHLRQLISRDTQNPPGNEILAAKYLDSVLQGIPGVETRIIDPGDGRANFMARLRATRPTKRPVLVMGHMDVVGADPTKWTTPPFEASERDGYVYGRGAIDDKGMLAATTAAFAQLAARRETLQRDVIFLGTAAEEGGGAEGIARVLAQHFDLIKDAEFALNEGGRVRLDSGRIRTIDIQVTEKLSYNVGVLATGPGGHASVPLPDNALAALARALVRVHEWKAPVRLNVVTREYFGRMATLETDPPMKRAMETIAKATDARQIDAAAEVLSRQPAYSAALRTGVSLTMIDAGIRVNVIPSDATATVNVREMPEGDIDATIRELNRVGGEKNVTFALRGQPQASPPISPLTTDLFKAMEAAGRAMAPGAIAIPFMSAGGTDGSHLRERGIPTYGILPLPLAAEDDGRMHGDNERVPIPALGWGAEYVYRVLAGVSE